MCVFECDILMECHCKLQTIIVSLINLRYFLLDEVKNF